MLVMTVFPCCSAYSCRSLIKETAVVESKPLVGSSNSSTSGSVNSSVAILTRFFSPPDTIIICESATLERRSSRINLSTS
mmetsp:Transcript_12155/g.25145  ORF Transcript_12155/g.25145 Transcript_12155/m.25145 type:complete len:80 (-) Transcript_12155:710-949(-)